MTPSWLRHSTVALLAAMALAVAAGFVAVGPVRIEAQQHGLAAQHAWSAGPVAIETLTCLPMLALAVWGSILLRSAAWPGAAARPLRWALLLVAAAAVQFMRYHQAPSDEGFALAQGLIGAASGLLLLGFLAERIDSRCGAPRPCWMALLAALAGLAWWRATSDLRMLWWLQLLPVLLIPAGALNVPGRWLSNADWCVMLAAYTLAHVVARADGTILQATGLVGGHSLAHLALGVVVGWLVYRVRSAAPGDVTSRPSASLNTASW